MSRTATRLALLLGDPVAHSLSPAIHNAAFAAAGIEAVYLASRVPPASLPAAVAGLRHEHVLGANVTVPHKEAVITHLDALDETAAAIGAVNTIVRRGSMLTGFNTDVAGFLSPLAPDEFAGLSVVVLGSGGAARAVAYALMAQASPASLTIATRSPARGEAVAQGLTSGARRTEVRVTPLAAAGPHIREAALIVNATPVGMHPSIDASPWPDADDFRAGQLVYDLVYNPRRTRLLMDAASRGARTLDGLEMLIGQAARAFLLWTGRVMPEDAVRAALAGRNIFL
jgi:shikimate dehydrogenase